MLNRLLLIALLALALTACGGGGGGSKEDSGSNTPGAPSSPTNPGDDGGSKTPEEEQYERDQETRETVAGMAASSLLLVLDHVDGYATLVDNVLPALIDAGPPPKEKNEPVPGVCITGQVYLKPERVHFPFPDDVHASFDQCHLLTARGVPLVVDGDLDFRKNDTNSYAVIAQTVNDYNAVTLGISHYGSGWRAGESITIWMENDGSYRVSAGFTMEKRLDGSHRVLVSVGSPVEGDTPLPLLNYRVNGSGQAEVEIPAFPGIQVSVTNTKTGSDFLYYDTVASNGALTKLVLTESLETECNGTPTGGHMQVRALSGSLRVIDNKDNPQRAHIYEVVGGDPQRFDVKKYDKDGNHTPVALAPGDDDQCNYLSRLAP